MAITWVHMIAYCKCLVQAGKHRWYEARDGLVQLNGSGYLLYSFDVWATFSCRERLDTFADDRESSMVCPACLTAMVVSQLPTIASAAVGAAGIKLAYDQKQQPKARDVKGSQPVRIMKVVAGIQRALHIFLFPVENVTIPSGRLWLCCVGRGSSTSELKCRRSADRSCSHRDETEA